MAIEAKAYKIEQTEVAQVLAPASEVIGSLKAAKLALTRQETLLRVLSEMQEYRALRDKCGFNDAEESYFQGLCNTRRLLESSAPLKDSELTDIRITIL